MSEGAEDAHGAGIACCTHLGLVVLGVVAKLQIVVGLAARVPVFTSAAIFAILAHAFPWGSALLLVVIVNVETRKVVMIMLEGAGVNFKRTHHEQGTVAIEELQALLVR